MNLSHRINIPYSGSFVPNAVLNGSCTCDLVSVMLEFNKQLYCDENGNCVEVRALQLRNLMSRILVDCVDLD